MLNTSKLKEFKSSRIASIVPAKSRPNGRVEGAGAVTIINSQRNGKRVEIPAKTMQRLGNPDFVEFGFNDNCMVIGTGGLDEKLRMKVARSGSKGVVYNASIVQEATEYLQLDFTKNRVSRTLYKVEFEEEAGEIFAFISGGSEEAQPDAEAVEDVHPDDGDADEELQQDEADAEAVEDVHPDDGDADEEAPRDEADAEAVEDVDPDARDADEELQQDEPDAEAVEDVDPDDGEADEEAQQAEPDVEAEEADEEESK